MLARYFHTLRHLRASQIIGRAKIRLRHLTLSKKEAPPLRKATGTWVLPVLRPPSLHEKNRFFFLNEEHELITAGDWNNAAWDKLWLYNLHYFDDLNASGATIRRTQHRALIGRWIAENPPPHGNGWEPYPLSLRIVNWIKWALSPNEMEKLWRDNLCQQVRLLSQQLEYHLLGNHLFANAKALIFAGCFFDGEEANHWLATGLEILANEIPEQILDDGGHFELSPMYHSIILEDILDLLNIISTYGKALPCAAAAYIEPWSERAAQMFNWLAVMSHPDGRISFFNDAAFSIAAEPEALVRYADRLALSLNTPPQGKSHHLSASGYILLARGPWHLLFDAAPIGPDYLPGHAHADSLSFELSYGTERVICHTGTSCYGISETRLQERGSEAHNTVTIDHKNSSEVWSGFRVARRAYPINLQTSFNPDNSFAACSHTGYSHLAGNPIHRRKITLSDHALTWCDEITGSGTHKISGSIPLHPDIRLTPDSSGGWILHLAGGCRLKLISLEDLPLNSEIGHWAPEFGLKLARPVLKWEIETALPIQLSFALSRESN